MKTLIPLVMIALGLAAADAGAALSGDTLSEVKKKGVLVAGVRDSLPPFGVIDKRTGRNIGYDIDYVNAIAGRLGVKVKFVPTTPETRIEQLRNGEIDIVAASMTVTPERAKQVDFSYTYFLTGQRFIVKKGGPYKYPRDFAGKTVGVANGTTGGEVLAKEIPTTVVRYYDTYPQVFQALRKGEVVALSTDEVILRGLYLDMPDKEEFEISPAQISGDAYGLAVRKGDKRLLDFINTTLMEMEKSGEADKIFDKWFGPGTPYKRIKNFNRGLR